MGQNQAKQYQKKRSAIQERIKALAADPEYSGIVAKDRQVYKRLDISKHEYYGADGPFVFAQAWLMNNTAADVSLKEAYGLILKKKVAEAHVGVKINNKHFVSKDTEVISDKRIQTNRNLNTAGFKATMDVKTVQTEIVEVSEEEKLVDQVRKQYVYAAPGSLPRVHLLLKELGLESRGTDFLELVYKTMNRDSWQDQRKEQISNSLDIIPEEISLQSLQKKLSTQQFLFDEITNQIRMNRQYYRDGKVTTASGVKLEHKPSLGELAGASEVMRRMIDGGPSVNIQINQFKQGGDDKPQTISITHRQLLGRLSEMSLEQLQAEASRVDDVISILTTSKEVIDVNTIDAQNTMETINPDQKNTEKSEPET